ncbi:HAD family phosphatase [Blastococcus sp. TF02-8]|uniref:HAD family hydrolase n=1 Tax=Blastococcus sp. TF02-8 TaxID=2250574 RepID=UPI000DE85FE5|nr:HAD family phosphatase [Blastococcus sp. TF02-8]RBY96433.1 HAD family phosphatase [Blastococcus sp. TF02-8]
MAELSGRVVQQSDAREPETEGHGMEPVGTALRGLLFDLDGTLVDTRAANYEAYRAAFEESGHALTPERFEGTWGRDSRDFIPDLLPGIPSSEVDDIRAAKSRIYAGQLHRTIPNEALIAFLRLVAPSHRTALVSTAKSANGEQILQAHGIRELFDVVVWGDQVQRSKPDPEGYLTAMRALGVEPAECLAFEDSDTGRRAAIAAGIAVLEVPSF